MRLGILCHMADEKLIDVKCMGRNKFFWRDGNDYPDEDSLCIFISAPVAMTTTLR